MLKEVIGAFLAINVTVQPISLSYAPSMAKLINSYNKDAGSDDSMLLSNSRKGGIIVQRSTPAKRNKLTRINLFALYLVIIFFYVN